MLVCVHILSIFICSSFFFCIQQLPSLWETSFSKILSFPCFPLAIFTLVCFSLQVFIILAPRPFIYLSPRLFFAVHPFHSFFLVKPFPSSVSLFPLLVSPSSPFPSLRFHLVFLSPCPIFIQLLSLSPHLPLCVSLCTLSLSLQPASLPHPFSLWCGNEPVV